MDKSLLQFSSSSIYCPQADIHIDPWKPVDFAMITHAHSDHARPGCKHYLAHKDSESILRLRLGEEISLQTVEYGEKIIKNGVQFSLHPAGHVIGSSQIRVEHKGEVWVASGDYKVQDDHFSKTFEPVKCNTFITESTFGLPIYKWRPQQEVMNDIKEWWKENQLQDKASVLLGYALGKMQRLIKNLQPFDHPVFAHGAIYNVNERLRAAGFDLPHIPLVTTEINKKMYRGALILGTSSSLNTPWLKKFEPYSVGYCSGWMAVRGAKNRRSVDRGFILSDHADWNELNSVIAATGAEKVYVTHGYTDAYSQWLNEQGIEAEEVSTKYGEEEDVTLEEVRT
ncbi:MAG: ligase-associated DNA damage response exonuclease [Cyclobacteriaceae bacterium]|nr:ligase-associated DNA damage response exonuclease [Cyclobacteriaceae bacterium]